MRKLLANAMEMISKSLVRLQPLLARVHEGFDSNVSYCGFCDGNVIIINIAAYMQKTSKATQRTLLHELVSTVTHELAHLLERSGGHGPAWRDTHMTLLQEVYADAINSQASSCSSCSK